MENISYTENGAVGYKTSNRSIVDLNFMAASFRNNPSGIVPLFEKSYTENPVLTMRWLFYCRDIRGGMGERAISRAIYKWLQWKHPGDLKKVMELLPEYGRWDDVVYLLEFSGVRDDAFKLIQNQLNTDLDNLSKDKPVSLIGKWLPSMGASNDKAKSRAHYLAKRLGYSYTEYSKVCGSLRKKIDIVERKMTLGEWGDINYSAVPSKANLKYRKAFGRHDSERYGEFLNGVLEGTAEMHSGTLMPYEIVHKYTLGEHSVCAGDTPDESIEAMWKSLPSTEFRGMVILDGSASMDCKISGSYSAHDMADSLAVYLSNQMTGPMHGKFITFSREPHFVDISECNTLMDALKVLSMENDCSNTDLWKVYKMLADMACALGVKQEDLPERMVIVSDMEFDGCCGAYSDSKAEGYYSWYDNGFKPADKALFDKIKEYWSKRGYKVPKLVFWNVNSRSHTIPVYENELGVILMSGFSTQTVKMAMSGQTDPFMAVYETLMDKRYDAVEAKLMGVA